MTWTYYTINSAGSTSTITLEPGVWYEFRGKETYSSYNLCIYNSGGTNLTGFYKLVSWAYA